jgi:hypothetical protein
MDLSLFDHSLCWLHGLSAGQIENFLLQLSGALTTKWTLSQAWEERPCPLGQQLTGEEAHSLVCVSFRKENDKQLFADSHHNNKCARLFSDVPHASGRHLFISERTYALLR